MNQPDGRPNELDLDAFLDGAGDERQRAAFEQRLAAEPELRRQVELQGEVDGSLRRRLAVAGPPRRLLERLQEERPAPRIRAADRNRVFVAAAAALAAGVLVAATWRTFRGGAPEPHFEPRSVAAVYHDLLAEGFEPYYECREDDRFAATFAKRQGRPLWLAPPPPDVHMRGLSYPGGTSRDSTAMLCDVDGEPVMVLVDRLEHDAPKAAHNPDEGLHVFRQERFGLVFYEVGPWDSARVTPLFTDAFATGVSGG